MNFKRLLILLVFSVAAFPIRGFPDSSPLEVIIKSKKDVYSLKENLNANGWKGGFRINFIIKNISPSKQEFGYWTCSYSENWKTDSDQVHLLVWTCKSNFISPKVLEPGETFSGEVPIGISTREHEPSVKFKLAFLPTQKTKNKLLGTFWSNEIEVKVVE